MATRRSISLLRWRRNAVRRMRGARAATLAFVRRLPEPDVVRPRTIDRWSVKDVLAHLMTCDEETVRRLGLIARGQADRIHWFESMADADRFNARSVAGARRLGLGAVLRRMARIHGDLVKRVGRLPVTALRDPAHRYPVTEWLPAPGWSHEREHLAEIKAWWRSHRPAVTRRSTGRRASRAS
jgi:hypothetical protein